MGDTSINPGLNFTAHMEALCRHACATVPELAHIDMDRVAVTYRQARKSVSYGLQACLTPLRFEHGALETTVAGRMWRMPRMVSATGRDLLYLLSFYLPRFLDRPFHDKLVTIFHELWHINPAFDGDLRRHEGRCYMHSARQADFDAQAESLAQTWLAADPPRELFDFLQFNFRQLARRHGAVLGMRAPLPKMAPLK